MIGRMGATTTYGWPTPNLTDPANGPQNIYDAATAIENTVKDTTLTDYTPAWTSNGSVQPGGTITKLGKYRLDHGKCSIWISFLAGAAVSGGTGNLYIGLPVAPRAGLTFQIMDAWFWCPYAGGGVYKGFGRPFAGNLTMSLYFPTSASDTRLNQWINATEGNGAGTGVPLIPSWFGMVQNSEVVVQGSYFV